MARRCIALRVAPAFMAAALLAAGCTTETTTTSSDRTSSASASSATDTPGGRPSVDPLIPYSPPPTPLEPTTNGFVTETLTLPTGDGRTMLVTVGGTAIDMEFVDGHRSVSVWVTLENTSDEAWTGDPAAFATISDEAGNVFEAIEHPTAADLHPEPERYDASNLDLHATRTIRPGDSVEGVIVFQPTGGNRLITISISLNGGGVWGRWTTTMGPF